MIGRKAELEQLRAVLDQALRERSCRLFTIFGDAGVGKSRLASEFLAGLEARVVRGRCLSYGKGITYWPIVEVVKQLDALPKNEAAAAAIRSLLGKISRGRVQRRSPGRSASCSSRKRRTRRWFVCSTICTGEKRHSSTL